MTTYEYDGAGRLTRSVTVSEPRWLPGDVDTALASRAADAAPRGRHGYLLAEATDPARQHEWEVPESAMGIPLPTVDFIQKRLTAAQTKRKKLFPEEDTSSLLWKVRARVSNSQ